MKKIISALALLVAVAFTITSCESPTVTPQAQTDFATTAMEVGAYGTSGAIFEFNKDNAQTSIRTGGSVGYQYKVQTDDQSKYFTVKLSKLPTTMSETATATVAAVGITGLEAGDYSVTVAKVDASRVWLWSAAKNIGFVVGRQ